jgi:hypothetical protein
VVVAVAEDVQTVDMGNYYSSTATLCSKDRFEEKRENGAKEL